MKTPARATLSPKGARVGSSFSWFQGAAAGMSDCYENDNFAPRGTNNCRFFGPKNGPQNDSVTESLVPS